MKKKLNNTIAIVITGLSFGGAERVTSYLANYFVDQGRHVHIISLTTGVHAYPLDSRVAVTEFHVDDAVSPLVRYKRLISMIRKAIVAISPSIVLGMMSYSGGLASVACLGLGVPFVISERNDPFTSTGFTPKEKRVLRFVYRHFVTKAIFQSKGALSFYYDEDDRRGVVIPNPLFIETLPPISTSKNREQVVVSAGRLNAQKNYSLLIKAFARVHTQYPDYRLVIYGEGEERPLLESLIDELGLGGTVSLPGIVQDIFERYSEASMFVMSSQYEGMPNALIEAMAMGLPCITTDYSEGRGTVIESGVNGLVVPRNDVDALSSAMLGIVEDSACADRYGQAALSVRTELDSAVICKAWYDVLVKTEQEHYQG